MGQDQYTQEQKIDAVNAVKVRSGGVHMRRRELRSMHVECESAVHFQI